MSTQEAKVRFTGDQTQLKATVAQVKADIASVGKVAKEQKTIVADFAQEQAGALTKMAGGFFTVEAAAELLLGTLDKYKGIQIGSEKSGLSAEFLQKLSNAAEVTETDLNAVTTAAGKLDKAIVFGKEADLCTQALNALGMQLEDLQKLSPDDLFSKVGNSISEIPDPVQRAAAAMAIFGKSGKDLIPVFEELEKHKSAAIVSNEDIKNIDEAANAWTRLKQVLQATVGQQLAKAITNPRQALFEFSGPGQLYKLFGGDTSKVFPKPPAAGAAQSQGANEKPSVATSGTEKPKQDFVAMIKANEEAAAKKVANDAAAKKSADDLAKRNQQIAENESEAEKIRHDAALQAMDDEHRLGQMKLERAELEKQRARETDELQKSIQDKEAARQDAEIAGLQKQIELQKAKQAEIDKTDKMEAAAAAAKAAQDARDATADARMKLPAVTAAEANLNDQPARDGTGTSNFAAGHLINAGLQRVLNRRAALAQARENRWRDRGIGGPASTGGQGSNSAAEALAKNTFGSRDGLGKPQTAADLAKSRLGMMSDDGRKPSDQNKGKDDVGKTLNDIRDVLKARLPKQTTGSGM